MTVPAKVDESLAPTPMLSPGSRHAIKIRKPGFSFDDVPNHWLPNPIATHVFNGLNLIFPDGERFFIDAVRDHLDEIDDPALRTQIRAFFGQEGRHAHEHEHYFETLSAQGYEIETYLDRFQRFSRFMTRWMPKSLRLAMTAGAEHYTATLGAFSLDDPLMAEAHPTMRALILWHATEEIEHKAVAYDVLQATHPSYLLRIAGLAIATVTLFGWAGIGTRMLLRQDVRAGRLQPAEVQAAAEGLRERRRKDLRRLRRDIRDYLRRDFHPNQVDDLGRAHAKLVELGLDAA